MGKDDNDLVQEYLEGNDESFKFLVEKYNPSIYNFAIRFVGSENVNDIVQEVFIKIWKNIRKFNSKKANFKTWLFRITRNTITDFLRKKKNITFSSLDKEEEAFMDNIPDEVILPDEALMKLEDKELLNSLLGGIPSLYAQVLILYYQEEMTFSEIGELLDKPMNTVKSYHYRALAMLRKMLEV